MSNLARSPPYSQRALVPKNSCDFDDVLVLARKCVWAQGISRGLPRDTGTVKVPWVFMEDPSDALALQRKG